MAAAAALVSVGAAPPAASTGETEPWIDTRDRAEVLAAYQAEHGSEVPPIDWDGGTGPCDAGTSSADSKAATIARVNYYRAMAGVAAVVTEEPLFSAKAQLAAMMMSSQGELTHSPAPTFACFTTDGQEAAGNSNLYLGRTGVHAIDGYIEDPGDSNTDVGHRTTILHPPTVNMGVGDVGRSDGAQAANVLWVFDERVFDEWGFDGRADGRIVDGTGPGTAGTGTPPTRELLRFVAWPPRGYVPADLVHPRWSFTLAGADFTDAEVVMIKSSAPPEERQVPLEVVDRTGAPGRVPLPTIVWEPEITPDPAAATDTRYLVVVRGVRPASGAGPGEGGEGGVRSVYLYEVRVMGEEPGEALSLAELLGQIQPVTEAAAGPAFGTPGGP